MYKTFQIKILNPDVRQWGLPQYHSQKAAAMDLYLATKEPQVLGINQTALLPTGIAIYLDDPTCCAMILPRSGLGHSKGLILGNGVGLIDADYQGELKISCWNRGHEPQHLEPGMRIAQMIILPLIRADWQLVDDFIQSDRGERGFGSTGGYK